ncbi:SDR family NAD(P)-dependent oxidoreductase [Amycolatopsis sp. H20-H5]|uniref:SDR family NAD(P)-dependent oxidoreductase n=1 Tax=Amycolatopsis sp. H20-H5 TaxID=3046309 RepID=UPI002DB9355D|nr:SDR family NAD(P)-dependent oxidoreductase [Amycolatopsis sp. H20-H5]MEC3974515.1 SDR family NAD(P)-dependent oxidoreductase [Amycolatopsis sp. H20-H5]
MLTVNDLFSLAGRTALVTGASRGIGKAIALAYAEAGADVGILARGTSELEKLAGEIEELGRRAVVLTCDLSDPRQLRTAVSTALTELGQIDVLVNNAGGFDCAGPFIELDAGDWAEVMRLNFDTVVQLCRELGRHFLQRGSGSVVNVSSIAGVGGVPMLSPYAASKAAIISLSRTLAAEWASRGVRVNALTPGWISTELTKTFAENPEASAGLLSAVPAGRWGTPEDVVGAAIFLATDASRLVTGSCLTVDGGATAYVGGPMMLELLSLGRIES